MSREVYKRQVPLNEHQLVFIQIVCRKDESICRVPTAVVDNGAC